MNTIINFAWLCFVPFLIFAFVLQVSRWRKSTPTKYLFWFFKFWVFVPSAAAILIFLMVVYLSPEANWKLIGVGIGWGFISYLSICASFVLVYPAISRSSLSLDILRLLEKHGAIKVSAIELDSKSGSNMLTERLENLISSGMLTDAGGAFQLTEKGLRIAFVFNLARILIGVGKRESG